MDLRKAVRADFGSDLPARDIYTARDKLAGFSTLVRPVFLLMTPLNAASAAVLSIRGFPSWEKCAAGFITAALAAAGVNIFNKYADRERDKIIWPARSIPSGRVKASQALILSCLFYIIALFLSWVLFNPTTFWLLLAAIVLGSFYSTHLRDGIGYLSLPLIEGLIFLCGWAALSPGTVFSSPVSWYLYFLGVVWQTAHILVHYLLNIRYDSSGRPIIRTPAFFSKPSPRMAGGITLAITIALFIMSVLLPLVTPLSYIYFIPAAAWGIYTIYRCVKISVNSSNNEKVNRAWSAISVFRLVISAGILVSVLVYG